ncbi:hypothetical protein Tco_0677719 [Tanacetum coccineum]|uniref:Conserved oligomeric Golgi complex subunit 4 C-terminal domain-containing protein n=1 Tax=Tanacetum coccineum TaxID=301880 RepID=A0ABQ4XDQ9_9ASTR
MALSMMSLPSVSPFAAVSFQDKCKLVEITGDEEVYIWCCNYGIGSKCNLAATSPFLAHRMAPALNAVETNSRWLEVIMMQKRFSQLGGLQLDQDVRALVSHFSGMTQRTVRDKFARSTQMATILNLEKVSEILDFWGENAGPMTWRLTYKL